MTHHAPTTPNPGNIPMTILAHDRTGSVRTFDDNGRLRVERTPISKANICLYQGREIPHHARLGLNPDQHYRLLRDPHELAKAADSFNSLPVLEDHTPTSAQAHPRELTVGATMDNACFEPPYLTVGMVIFDGPAIRRIQSGEQKELSCGYAYEADMTPGTHEGQPYDGRMTNIRGNHVALVTKGRAGPDVLVHDSVPAPLPDTALSHPFSPPANRTDPTMTQTPDTTRKDHNTDMTDENKARNHIRTALAAMEEQMKKEGFTPEQAERCRTLCANHLGMNPADGTADSAMPRSSGKLNRRIENDTKELTEPNREKGEIPSLPDDGTRKQPSQREASTAANSNSGSEPPESREAALNAAIQKALSADRALRRATEEARRLVRPLVGDVHGMDSADDVYHYALQQSGMAADSLSGINQAGLRALVHARLNSLHPTPSLSTPTPLAADTASPRYTAPRRY